MIFRNMQSQRNVSFSFGPLFMGHKHFGDSNKKRKDCLSFASIQIGVSYATQMMTTFLCIAI